MISLAVCMATGARSCAPAALNRVATHTGGNCQLPPRGSPAWNKLPGAHGLQKMNEAKGLSAGTRKEYDRRVAVWVKFCARLTCQDGRPWNPSVFSWDVFELFLGSLLDEGATEEKCTKYQQALNDYFENLPGTSRERPLLQGKGPVSRIMKKYEQVA